MRNSPRLTQRKGQSAIGVRIGLVLLGFLVLLSIPPVAFRVVPTGPSDLPSAVLAGWSDLAALGTSAVAKPAILQRGPAPDVSLALYGGGHFRLADQHGKVVVMITSNNAACQG